MATSTQNEVIKKLTYNDIIKKEIVNSGATVVFEKDNIIVATEISEAEYRELLKNPHIQKMDVLPLKRYGNATTKYTQVITTDTTSISNTNIA